MREIYDFIIVGAGSAGCVLAERLTASGRHTVLLIEAGGSDRRFWVKLPVGYAFTFSDPKVNWCYTAAPDPGLNQRMAYWPRGKVIGGSSSINAMAYVRGLPHDFDDWATAGASGWGWDQVRPVFEALERNHEFDAGGTPTVRGDGPIAVADLRREMNPFTQHFLAAARELGWPDSDDMNAPAPEGSTQHPGEGLTHVRSTVKNGRRWSAADAFLRPAMKRKNLTVLRHAQVQQILTRNKRATGVALHHKEQLRQIRAAREVILSAGAVNSPHVLMLSGIGPAAELKQHGIEVRHDLPQVGKGLQDHLALSHYYWANTATLNAKLGHPLGQARAALHYALRRRGPLSVPVNQCSGFARTKDASRPDVQIYCNPASYGTLPDGKPYIDPDNGYLLCVQPSRPTSRGEITLASPHPGDAPIIRPNSLSTEADKATAIAASRLLQDLARTEALGRVTLARRSPDILEMEDVALLENFRNQAGSVFHASCSCRMGTDATTSVLDHRLRVHGMAGLRVIDASAFPNVTSGNTNAPTLMLAARAAELVLEDADHPTQMPDLAAQ